MRTFLRSRHLLIFVSIIILCICLGGIGSIYSFWAYPDEFGYWAPAAGFKGYDWSQVASIGSYYSYGYSLVLYVFLSLFKDGIMAYRAAIVFNSLLCIVAVWILYCFIREIRSIEGIKNSNKIDVFAAITGSVAVLYPAWSLYSQSTMSESLISFLFILVSFLMYRFLKKPGILNGILLAVFSLYMYLVHMRMIGTVIAIVITILIFAFCSDNRKIKIGVGVILIALVVVFALSFLLKSHIVSEIYSFTSDDTLNWNDYNGQLPKIIKLFSLQGIVHMLENIAGKVLYISLATYGLGLWGICAVSVGFVKGIKALKREGSKSIALFDIYVFLAILMQIGIAVIYLIDSPSEDNSRLDLLLHGRYTDMLIPILVVYGIYAIYNSKRPVILTGIISIIDAILMFPILAVIERNNTHMDELQGYTMVGVSYMLSPSDTDSESFVVRAVIFGIVATWVVCLFILFSRKLKEPAIMSGILLIQMALSVYTCNNYLYSIQPSVYTDILLTQRIESVIDDTTTELEDSNTDIAQQRQIIHIYEGDIQYIEIVQFNLRDRVIDVINAEKDTCNVEALPSDAIIVTQADTVYDEELNIKYDTAKSYGHLNLYFNK